MMEYSKQIPEQVRVAEIRHRMSNGFQILQAFTRQQISECETQDAAERLAEVLRQIEAVAAQQSALSEADSGNLAGFVERIEPLRQRIGEQAGITVRVDMDDALSLSPKASETASRILLEAVTNCVEHAFPDGRGGTIEVVISCTDRTVALIDDGRMDNSVVCRLCGGGVEQSVDERDLSPDPWFFLMNVTVFDRSYRLEPA